MEAKAPLRISFAGGGTDIAPYCLEHGGCVLSVAIKKYTYASYPDTPLNETEIEKTIINHLKPNIVGKVRITSTAPPMSGLGGSASCFVAGIKAVEPMLPKRKIAELAFHLERDVMDIAGGKQDQYMAAFGGLSFLEFTDRVKITQLRAPEGLEDLLLLVYMGKRKNAGQDIIKDQMERMNISAFNTQKEITLEMTTALRQSNLKDFGQLLNAAWLCKLEFSPLVASDEIKDFYHNCLKWGAIGGKLTGAGGGGYMLLMEDPKRVDLLKKTLVAKEVPFERVRFEGRGVCEKSS